MTTKKGWRKGRDFQSWFFIPSILFYIALGRDCMKKEKEEKEEGEEK